MSVDLSQFIPTFLEESFEGLELMESSLLNLEQGDDETINSIFRAAHSIKGGAGTFGFNEVTEFTHLVETLLDEMRDGRRSIVQEEIELLLESTDCMRFMIEAIRDEETYNEAKVNEVSQKLSEVLAHEASQSVATEEQDNGSTETTDEGQQWKIQFIPEHHLVQTGNDPMLLFNALADYGELKVNAQIGAMPSFADMDAQELYLQWQLVLTSDCSEEDIREVFEWVEDECKLTVEKLSADTDEKSAEVNVNNSEAEKAENNQTNPENSGDKATQVEEVKANITDIQGQQNDQSLIKSPEPSATEKTSKKTTKAKNDVGSIRVGVDKVDSLINLVGELVITQSMLSELGHDFNENKVEKLTAGLEQLLQNTKELQESVMRIRMLPISFAFNRFPRLIHDLSLKTGKQIELVINGDQTELDKTVMEQIGDPLVHLVRNAVDHGIEPAEQRLAAGKPAHGTIALDAYHQGGNIVIEIKDDGGGINRQAVFNKALEKGIVDSSMTLNDTQVFDLIFEPGFSTAAEVSDISGRGVGMDVVKKNIQALGGRIQVESEPGVGSTFKVNLPLTLAILDGQLVRVGTETYIIPLITIIESLEAKAELVNKASGDMLLYRLRDDNVPIIPIFKLFNLDADKQTIDDSLLVVVEADGQKIGLMVDDLLAQQQVVIKSLQDNYQQVDGISGATILGDGSVAMILDIVGIIKLAMKSAQNKQLYMERELQGALS